MPAANGRVVDPYAFGPVLGPLRRLLRRRRHASPPLRQARRPSHRPRGRRRRAFRRLGAECAARLGGRRLQWLGRPPPCHAQAPVGTGVWEIFVPELGAGTVYKYEILGADGKLLPLKADPFAFCSELRPKTASRRRRAPSLSPGRDADYLAERSKRATAAARRCRSTRCISAPGGAAGRTLPHL